MLSKPNFPATSIHFTNILEKINSVSRWKFRSNFRWKTQTVGKDTQVAPQRNRCLVISQRDLNMSLKYVEEPIVGVTRPHHPTPTRGRGQTPSLMEWLQLVKGSGEMCTIAVGEASEQGRSWLGDPFSATGVSQPHMWQTPMPSQAQGLSRLWGGIPLPTLTPGAIWAHHHSAPVLLCDLQLQPRAAPALLASTAQPRSAF